MHEHPDSFTTWFFAIYGATMLAVQSLENSVSFLYLVANTDAERRSNASTERQWRDAYWRMWRAFQRGTSGMKLNDAKRGIKAHISPELYEELDKFITGPRAQLAHRYLFERVVTIDRGDIRNLAAAAGELIPITQQAERLRQQLDARNEEIRASWPKHEQPPEDVQKFVEEVGRITMLKQFPKEVLDKARAAREADQRERQQAS
jgi:hypothetical protein